jgi:AAA+ superfamily predicted ATPase
METFIKLEKLKALFHAYSERNDKAFLGTADSIILQELAANHHSVATELRRALHSPANGALSSNSTQLSSFPKQKRTGDSLIFFDHEQICRDRFILQGEGKIRRVLDEHERRDKLSKYGYSPKRKLLFWGPPGCGKTITARYLSAELGLPLGIVRLSAVISSFVGDTAAHIHQVFAKANETPMVLLLDEVDAIGKNRNDPNDVGELKRVVNGLLQSMDAFKSRDSIVIAASNHQYLLDPALWRRFDDIIEFPLPDTKARIQFIKTFLNGIKFKGSLTELGRVADGLSFADIERAIVEALKAMILEDRSVLSPREIFSQIKIRKAELARASKGVRKG